MSAKIIVTKLGLTNFKNIKHSEFNLFDHSMFSGKNYTGKTNHMDAIYWLLTDRQFDGTADNSVIKPKDDSRAEVIVSAIFLNQATSKMTCIEKHYKERWTTTRGSDVETLSGNDTWYVIDGIKQSSIKNALLEIKNSLSIPQMIKLPNEDILSSKIDAIQLAINPLYFTEQIEWEERRRLVIALVGDVPYDSIFKSKPYLESITPTLEQFNGDFTKAMKLFKQNIKEAESKQKGCKAVVDNLALKQDVDQASLGKAQVALEDLRIKKMNLESGIKTDDPCITTLKAKKQDLTNKVNSLIENERARIDKANAEVRTKAQAVYDEYNQALVTANELTSKVNSKLAENNAIQNDINKASLSIQSAKESRERLLSLYKLEKHWTAPVFVAKEYDSCPNCGYALDKVKVDELNEKEKASIEKAIANHEAQIEDIKQRGINAAEQIELSTMELKEAQSRLNKYLEEKQLIVDEQEKAINLRDAKKLQYDAVMNSLVNYQPTSEIESLQSDLKVVETELNNLLTEQQNKSKDDYYKATIEIQNQMKPYQEIVDKHIQYLGFVKELEAEQLVLDKANKNLLDAKTLKTQLEEFEKDYLTKLNGNVSKVFGDLQFDLVSDNIKEDSWDPICECLIKNKHTGTLVRFNNGSTSEKVTNGIEFIEKIKPLLSLPDLPILFDECKSLDNDTIKALPTQAQLITSGVDNESNSIQVAQF